MVNRSRLGPRRARLGLAALAALSAIGLAGPTMARPSGCKLALALGLDISSSVSAREYQLQLHGLANAIEHEDVMNAILSPEGAGIAVIAYEWSGQAQQDLITEWEYLADRAAIRGYAGRLRAHRRTHDDLPTAIGRALVFGAGLFADAPFCMRQVIDLSGDGENNDGPDPASFQPTGIFERLTINGLVITGAFPDPAAYYRQQVIMGPDAFVLVARDFGHYEEAMIRKLLREIGQELVLGLNDAASRP